MNLGIMGVYCSSETPQCQNAKNWRKFDLFIYRSDGLGTERQGIQLNEVGKKKRKRKEGKRRGTFKKTRPPGYAKPRHVDRGQK